MHGAVAFGEKLDKSRKVAAGAVLRVPQAILSSSSQRIISFNASNSVRRTGMKQGCLVALGFLIAIIGIAVFLYNLAYPTYTYRCRITVDVDTPEGLRSASNVVQIDYAFQPILGSAPSSVSHVQGDAIFIDLGNGRNVVSLLNVLDSNGGIFEYPSTVIFGAFKVDEDSHQQLREFQSSTEKRELTPDHYPTFVTFKDLNDPLSAQIVEPRDFATAFGFGTALRAVTIEMTHDPVTYNIAARFPWWRHGFSDLKNPDGSPMHWKQQQTYFYILGSLRRGR